MRLNSNTFPAYQILEKGNFSNLPVDTMIGDIFFNSISSTTDFMSSLSQIYSQVSNRYYITHSFEDAVVKALPKIVKAGDYIDNSPSDCGVIFTDNGFTLYLSNPSDKEVKLIAYGFTRNTLTSFGIVSKDNSFKGIYASLDKEGKPHNNQDELHKYLNSVLVTVYFIHNCEIETAVLKPKEKLRQSGQKHFNESNSNLIILDCRWFTEMIRDEPFTVTDFWRWQACGEGFKKRKLKYIPSFEKKGYHRKATKGLISQ